MPAWIMRTGIALGLALIVASGAGLGCGSNVQSESAPIADQTEPEQPRTPVLARSATAMPDFVLQDLKGNTVRLSDFEGKAVFINFWATWCAPCKAELPDLVEVQSEFGGEDFVIVGISLDRIGAAAVDAYVQKTGLNFPILMGNPEVVASYGNFRGIPTSFLINARHEEVRRYSGMITKAQLVNDLRSVLENPA